MGYPFNDYTGMQMGVDMAGWGRGLVSPPVAAPLPMRASMGMNTGRGLTGAAGNMPPIGAGGEPDAGMGGMGKGNFLSGFSNLAEGLSGLGKLYIGLKGLGIAKDQLAFSKESYQTNLANQKKSYNTALEDRIRSRFVTEGRSSGEADAYLAKNNM